ncbi:aldo/keto reductase [Mycetocola manganoxydans]|uniref:Aldo/keto reductase n=1 Tax=Mycetocola manganoxydans TaxID=699879 RepID=A0A3L7A0H7_9MICO|nr:aldo/keto reductase [Mycetocola manganoxydans]RLP73793.1 aldo/keto reductase [Mycetocola manganoxydans]GHD43038.1 oxidoreductase [Mycetocola manganoxydans]
MASGIPSLSLNDGTTIPQLGLGVYKVPEKSVADVVTTAIDAGYRHIDTATLYANEKGVGEGIRRSGIDRDELYLTTKVWNSDHGFDSTLRAFDTSMELLGVDVLDLYLIHWPAPTQNRYVDTWRALERLKEEGRTRSIGVSNFHPHHLERLFDETSIVPAVNQIELHPWLPQSESRAFHEAHGIITEAWSPLARGGILDNPTLDMIAQKHGVSAAQVVLRWHLQLGNVVIPKSVTPSRIAENIDVLGFELDDDDITGIATLESGERTGRDPDDLD